MTHEVGERAHTRGPWFLSDEEDVGENYNEDLRAALEQAMTAEPYPPARPVYDGSAVRASLASEKEG